MSGSTAQRDGTERALEAAAEVYATVLRDPDAASAAREQLSRQGVDDSVLREFGVGYAPGDFEESLEALTGAGVSADELVAAGVANRSGRGHLQAQFRSRVMFPMRDARGRLTGFAGMATNPGPSWPLWLTSPESERYARSSALFGIDAAREAIAESGRVLVLSDCIGVLLAHQRGERATVAVIRSPLMRPHLERLAAVLGVGLTELWVDRDHRAGDVTGSLVVRADARTEEEAETLTRADLEPPKTNPALRSSEAAIAPDAKAELTSGGHVALWVSRIALGLGIPAAWMAIMQPSPDDPAASPRARLPRPVRDDRRFCDGLTAG